MADTAAAVPLSTAGRGGFVVPALVVVAASARTDDATYRAHLADWKQLAAGDDAVGTVG